MKNLKFDEFKVNTISLTLVEFWSCSCYACFLAQYHLEQLEKAYCNRCDISKINVTEEAKIIDTYSIKILPTFILFKDSIELERVEGFRNKDIIEKMIRLHL